MQHIRFYQKNVVQSSGTSGSSSSGSKIDQDNTKSGVRLELPQSTVNRLIKEILPSSMSIQKDAKAAFTRAATIWVVYLAHV